jgi:Zn finger protein HypA/HybF involved in hydrogenase expression
MHESHLLESIFGYLDREEKLSAKRIRKVYITLSEFGGISEGHFKEHYKNESAGTKWENLDMEINRRPYGPELEITKIDFA